MKEVFKKNEMQKTVYSFGGYHDDFMRHIETELREFSRKYEIGLSLIISIVDNHRLLEDYEARMDEGSEYPRRHTGEMRICFPGPGGEHFMCGQAVFPEPGLQDGFSGFKVSSNSIKSMGDWVTFTDCEPVFHSLEWEEIYLVKS